jgi:hypothetical protein
VPAHAPLVGQIGKIFGEVEHRRRVKIGAEPKDASADPAEAIEGRARTVIIVPRRVFEQLLRPGSARAETAGRIVGHKRAGATPEDFGEVANFVKHRGCRGIEGRRVGQKVSALGLRQPVDEVVLDFGAKDHEQSAVGSDGGLQRIEQRIRTAFERTDRA